MKVLVRSNDDTIVIAVGSDSGAILTRLVLRPRVGDANEEDRRPLLSDRPRDFERERLNDRVLLLLRPLLTILLVALLSVLLLFVGSVVLVDLRKNDDFLVLLEVSSICTPATLRICTFTFSSFFCVVFFFADCACCACCDLLRLRLLIILLLRLRLRRVGGDDEGSGALRTFAVIV